MKDLNADNEIRAGKILKALIQGLDPRTGTSLPGESVLHRAEVLRALLSAVAALERSAARALRRAQLPDNVGRAWSTDEQNSLITAFNAGESPQALARTHQRTLRAVEARLVRLGLLSAEQRLTRGGFPGVSDAAQPGRPRGARRMSLPLAGRRRRPRRPV